MYWLYIILHRAHADIIYILKLYTVYIISLVYYSNRVREYTLSLYLSLRCKNVAPCCKCVALVLHCNKNCTILSFWQNTSKRKTAISGGSLVYSNGALFSNLSKSANMSRFIYPFTVSPFACIRSLIPSGNVNVTDIFSNFCSFLCIAILFSPLNIHFRFSLLLLYFDNINT